MIVSRGSECWLNASQHYSLIEPRCLEDGYRGGGGSEMAPIAEWEPDDREELTELLEFAASALRQRIPTPSHLPSGGTG